MSHIVGSFANERRSDSYHKRWQLCQSCRCEKSLLVREMSALAKALCCHSARHSQPTTRGATPASQIDAIRTNFEHQRRSLVVGTGAVGHGVHELTGLFDDAGAQGSPRNNHSTRVPKRKAETRFLLHG